MDPTLSRRVFVRRSLALGGSTLVLSGCGSADAKAGAAAVMKALVGSESVTALPVATPTPTPTPVATFKWKPLRIGAGGWVTGIDIAPDGTKVCRCDSSGAYIWSDSISQWVPLLTMASMPAGYYGRESIPGVTAVYEVAVAPSNTNRIWMAYFGRVFRSDDKGKTFTKTALPDQTVVGNDAYRMFGRKMVVDPKNADIVFLGTQTDLLYATFDGGATWRTCLGVPKPTNPAGMRLAFDPASAVKSGATQGIYVSSEGNGVYISRDGGATFALTPNSPLHVQHLTCDKLGTLWATDGDTGDNLRKFEGGSWQAVGVSGTYKTIAVDPANPSHIVIGSAGGAIAQTYDHGKGWSGIYQYGPGAGVPAGAGRRVATDIPWLAWTSESYMSSGDMCFDPSATNKLYFAEGIGVWWANPPLTYTGFDWNSQSLGIEQLVSNEIVAPPGGKPLYLSWDRPIFRIENPDVAPQKHGPSNLDSIVMGWAADYAPEDPKTVALLANWTGVERSSLSTDGGVTWTQFGSMPAEIASGGKIGGTIAVASRTNFMLLPSNNGNPWFTKDAGKTWTMSSVPGVPTSGTPGWGWAYYFHRFALTVDKTNGTFYLYNYTTGLYTSTDGGATFTRVFTGQISDWTSFHAKLAAVPGKKGHLFFTAGPQDGATPAWMPLMRSQDGGQTWQGVTDTQEITAFGFGAAAAGKDYPAIFFVGYYKGKPSIWRSDDNAVTWVDLGAYPFDNGDEITAIAGDPDTYGKVYVGFGGSGAAYGQLS